VLGTINVPKKKAVTDERKKLQEGALQNVYSSEMITVIKPGRLRRVGNKAHMTDRTIARMISVNKPRGKDHLLDLRVDGMIILKIILQTLWW
jgi:hypothetical protein